MKSTLGSLYTFPSIEPLESRIAPALFIVTSTADSGPGTLRNALALADGHPGHNTILFHLPAPPAHEANIITLTSGVLTSYGNVTIQGPGAGKLIIDANYNSGVFEIGLGDSSTANPDRPTTIAGLSIIDGKVSNSVGGPTRGTSGSAGAGIYSYESLTLKDVVISGNVTDTVGGGVAVTGYVGAGTTTRINISNSVISGNYAADGAGGLSLDNLGSVVISNTVVTGNTTGAAGKAGGVYAEVSNLGHSVAITGSVISGNTAGTAGGLFVADYSTARSARVTISRTQITGNTAAGTGSGYGAGGGLSVLGGKTVITRSTIEGNTALYQGGGIFTFNVSSLTISKSTISGNRTTKASQNYGGGGGGIYFDGRAPDFPSVLGIFNSQIADNQTTACGGGVYANDLGKFTVSRSIFSANQASEAGGALCDLGSLSVTRSTFAGNTGSSGGAIYEGDRSSFTPVAVSISASRFTGNTSVNGGGGVYIDGASAAAIKTSVFSGNFAGTSGGGLSINNAGIFHIFGDSFTRNDAQNNSGGGIYIALSAGNIVESTISGNVASDGAGIFNDGITSHAITLFADNITGNTGLDGPNLNDTPGDLSTFRFL
jgi:parallel beta-helix repeat protein